VESLGVKVFVGCEHACVTERYKKLLYIVHLTVFMLNIQNIFGTSLRGLLFLIYLRSWKYIFRFRRIWPKYDSLHELQFN